MGKRQGCPASAPAPSTEVLDNAKWQAKLRAVPTEAIDSLPRKGRIALLEAGVQAAAAEEGKVLRSVAARRNVEIREDAIVRAATKRGLLESTAITSADIVEK